MSEWFRAFERSGEKPKPVHKRSVQIPAPLPAPVPAPVLFDADEVELARLRADLQDVETQLGNLNVTHGGRRLSSDEWNKKRQRLKQRKADLLPLIALFKAKAKTNHIARSAAESEARNKEIARRQAAHQAPVTGDIARACSIIAVLRSIVMDIDEQGPADTEAIRNAGAFLKEHGYLP